MKSILNLIQAEKTTPLYIIILIVVAFYGFLQYSNTKSIIDIESDLKDFTNENENKISRLEQELLITKDANLNLARALDEAREETDSVSSKINKIDGTVGDLEKLSKTDPELLQKYSKIYFLNEHYVPTRLAEIDEQYVYNKNKTYQIHAEVKRPLERLLKKAASEGMNLLVVSSYRSFDTQSALKSNYVVTYGAGTANQFSADQGYSEHQLGTTVDFTNPQVGGTFSGFSQTQEYQWLLDNAHKYGFVISYPANNSYYQFEPWHWRFVGEDLADDLHDDGKHFYDLDQREIDKYLIKIFD